ncbi:MAG: pantetheine-phosphate adenylyltransferase [Clostridia bacterium]|nr:pantetheine-phosphate adenylyltransferase [Clostridia bacterium]
MKKCIFAGTFDPFTVGHADTVEKSLAIFDEVVIAVAQNRSKQCKFSAQERLAMLELLYKKEPRVKIRLWDGAIVDLLKEEGTRFYVRGIRNSVDFDYETADFYASRRLDENLIEVYLPAEQDKLHISSTLVKNCMAFGKPYREYVPEAIYEYINHRG